MSEFNFTDGRKMVRTMFGDGTGNTSRLYLIAEWNRTVEVAERDEAKGREGYTAYRRGYLSGLTDLIGKTRKSGIER